MLDLIKVSKIVDGEVLIDNVSLSLGSDRINILLGATRAGKTSLLRMMAGLDRPSSGDIQYQGKSVLGVPVQKRRVAMVYQQFVNYPSMTAMGFFMLHIVFGVLVGTLYAAFA